MTWTTYEEILADIMADRPKPKPPPAVTPAGKAKERFAAENQPTIAVIDAATRGNDLLAERLETETMESRRQKQMAKEIAEHNAENPLWHQLCRWQQSVNDAQQRVRERYGEVPETGNYSPIARFEREMRGK